MKTMFWFQAWRVRPDGNTLARNKWRALSTISCSKAISLHWGRTATMRCALRLSFLSYKNPASCMPNYPCSTKAPQRDHHQSCNKSWDTKLQRLTIQPRVRSKLYRSFKRANTVTKVSNTSPICSTAATSFSSLRWRSSWSMPWKQQIHPRSNI